MINFHELPAPELRVFITVTRMWLDVLDESLLYSASYFSSIESSNLDHVPGVDRFSNHPFDRLDAMCSGQQM